MEEEPCQLCLSTDISQPVKCLADWNGTLQVCDVLAKHFWIQLNMEKNANSIVCQDCWTKVLSFHEYYEYVYTLHQEKTSMPNLIKFENLSENQANREACVPAEIKDLKPVLRNESKPFPTQPIDDPDAGNDDDNNTGDREDSSDWFKLSDGLDESDRARTPSPPRRRRGRPRKESQSDNSMSRRSQADASDGLPIELLSKYFSLQCDHCDTKFVNLLDAKHHYKAEHNEAGFLRCCDRKFDKQKSVRQHCFFHENPSENKCFDCEKIYANADRLATHQFTQHPTDGQPTFGCAKCGRRFTTSTQLMCHERRHDALTIGQHSDSTPSAVHDDDLVRRYISLTCDQCGYMFDTFNEARLHHRTVHDQNGYVLCCGKKFFKKFRVMQHCEWHADPKKFDCSICGKNFLDSVCLREHMIRRHAPEQDRMFQCEMCDRGFQQKCQLRYHQQKVHMRDEDKKFECYQCKRRFVFLSFLQNHIKDAHDPVPSFICDVCAKYFKTQASYELHYALEHSNVCQKVQCKLCGKWLKHAKTLSRHMFFHRATPETCPQCGHVAPSKRALYSHVRLVHRDPTHKCLVCGKMFKKTHTLKEHMAIHAGITDLYTCSYCPKTFRSSSNMYKHRKLLHSAEWEADKQAAAAAMAIGPPV